MEEDPPNSENSVYNLITKLCEKFAKDRNQVKKLRSLCYSMLLNKSQIPVTGVNNYKGPDAVCNVLAWQHTVKTQYGLTDYAPNIGNLAETVQTNYGENVLNFLMFMRQPPTISDEFTDFEMPQSFQNLYKNLKLNADSDVSSCAIIPHIIQDRSDSPDLWDIAASEKFNERRNWENLGLPEPLKEKPFLSELGDSSHLWVLANDSVYNSSIKINDIVVKPQVKESVEFTKDIKLLLLGLPSFSFGFNSSGNFELLPGITVKGIKPSTLKVFCQKFTVCGDIYRALDKISTPEPLTGHYEQDGYIFIVLCQSIQRYLFRYRNVISSLPDSMCIFEIEHRIKKIQRHLRVLAALFKIGPYIESKKLPHGVHLLNHIYKKILYDTFDQNILALLYSFLYPCCHVYFKTFIKHWLLEGSINDPYDEFYIKSDLKYISTKGRTYWTRSFTIRDDMIPEFLLDLQTPILNTGKAMNLLKLCNPSSKLRAYLSNKQPLIINSCLSYEHLLILKQNTQIYYLEALSECGPVINLQQIVRKAKEQDPIFMKFIAKKRAITLERIELERKKRLEEQREKKLNEITALKEQYDSALLMKQERIAEEIESNMKLIEFNLAVENYEDKLVEREAKIIIDYYKDLCEIAEKRQRLAENITDKFKNVHLEAPAPNVESKSSDESFYSLKDSESELEIHECRSEPVSDSESAPLSEIHSSKSLDILNANTTTQSSAAENFEMAKKIKEKVLKEELGLIIPSLSNKTAPIIKKIDNENLTEAQRNKLRVLNSEFGIDFRPQLKIPRKTLTQSEINRNLVLGSSDCFYGDSKRVDNANYLNKNITSTTDEFGALKMKKSCSFSHEVVETVDYVPTPMSVDSTPMSESTISKICLSLENFEVATTAGTDLTDDGEGFVFEQPPIIEKCFNDESLDNNFPEKQKSFSKFVPGDIGADLTIICLNRVLHDSISIPLGTHTMFINNEILKFFIDDLRYFKHLSSLRDYFFLQDGEFAKNITDKLYEKLHDAQSPDELINFHTLRSLIFDAFEMSSTLKENCKNLSFKIDKEPRNLKFGDPDVLDFLSMTYKVTWPLNILLPIDTISKYDQIFKYLLKLKRVSWVLQKIFMDLKILAKMTGVKEIYLMMSPQYRRLHQCRHVMMHFIQTLQNYIVGDVLQTCWDDFEQKLGDVKDLDALYAAHTTYIKNILFLCHLNQKSRLKEVFFKIFVVILKFYDFLRSKNWECRDGTYVHPNFTKLESIFMNFEEHVAFLFKVGKKVVKRGYQPYLAQLLDMLDVNGYYSKRSNTDKRL